MLLRSIRAVAGMMTIVAGPMLVAQSAAGRLRFDVASIKPADPNSQGGSMNFTAGGGFRMVNQSLQTAVLSAYGIFSFQLSGAPAWMGDDKFDITANPPAVADPKDIQSRLQTLLAERCKLSVHWDSKEMTAYLLTIDKNGPKFKAVADGENSVRMGGGEIVASGVEMAMLAGNLAGNLGRPVIDKTGLKRKYSFTLKWTPDPNDPDGEWGAPVFTALREQLGLKLERQKTPTPILVIDHVEKPSAN